MLNPASKFPGTSRFDSEFSDYNVEKAGLISRRLMLACDLLMNVRASRTISGEQVAQLEKMVFADGGPSRDQLDFLCLIDTYLERPHPGWAPLFARATMAAFRHAPERGHLSASLIPS
jgi:hypothetical protein